MDFAKSTTVIFTLLSMCGAVFAAQDLDEIDGGAISAAKANATAKKSGELDSLGFGPAFYVIKYSDEIIADTKDVRVRGDGTLTSTGYNYSTSFGVEIHYDFTFGHYLECVSDCDNDANWNISSGHRLSPFLGLYDLGNGINGIAAGIIYGYWKGDGKMANKTTLNAGIGWTIHKNQLVLSGDVQKGAIPPTGLNVEDYTERKDVEGVVIMISANMGF